MESLVKPCSAFAHKVPLKNNKTCSSVFSTPVTFYKSNNFFNSAIVSSGLATL